MATLASKPGEDGKHVTYCRMCNSLCGMVATVENGVITSMKPDHDNPASKGHICVKGPSIATITQDPDRILHPMKRTGRPGEFERVSWDEALDDIAARMRAIVDEHGPDALACYHGNPNGYSWFFAYGKKFGDAFGTHKQFSSSAVDTQSRKAASELVWGNPWTFLFPDMPSSDFMLVLGSNLLVSQGTVLCNPRMREDLNAIARRGRVIIVDPRRTETARLFEHVPIKPDTDVYLLCAMLRIMDDEGFLDRGLIADHTSGAAELLQAVHMLDVDDAARLTGIAAETIHDITRTFARTPRAVAYSRLGTCRGTFPTLSNVLIDMVNLLSGKIGKEGCAVFGNPPNPHEKALGGDAVGATRTIGKLRTRIGNLPSVNGDFPTVALPADILEPGPGRVRALMATSGNPVLSHPGGDTMERALQALELFFSIDLYLTETNRYAHYILPATTFIERDDMQMHFMPHMVRPHLQYARGVIEPLGEARSEIDIMNDIVKRAGYAALLPTREGSNTEVDFRELPDAVLRNSEIGDGFGARPDGVSVEKLAAEYPHGKMIEGRYPLDDWRKKISTADRKVHCWGEEIAAEFDRLAQSLAAPVPALRLFGLRDLRFMNSWTANPERLVRSASPAMLIHPDDARSHNVADGGTARLSSASGTIEVKVKVTEDVIPGSVCYPHGWGHNGGWQRANAAGGANVNLLASIRPEDQEAVSGMAKLEGIPVWLEPAG